MVSRIKLNNGSTPVLEYDEPMPNSIIAVDISHDSYQVEEIKKLFDRVYDTVSVSSNRIGNAATRVSRVQDHLISVDHDSLYKDEVDQLLTAAKDLYGNARAQVNSLNDVSESLRSLFNSTFTSVAHGKMYLGSAATNKSSVLLPEICSDVLSSFIYSSETLNPVRERQDLKAGRHNPGQVNDDFEPGGEKDNFHYYDGNDESEHYGKDYDSYEEGNKSDLDENEFNQRIGIENVTGSATEENILARVGFTTTEQTENFNKSTTTLL